MLTVSSAVTLCVLLYSLAQGSEDGDEAAPGLDLPPDVPGADRGRRQRVPVRRPVQPLRRLRDPARGALRAASRSAAPASGSGRARIYVVVALLSLGAVPRRDRADLRRDRHGEPGPARACGCPRSTPACGWCCRCMLLLAFGDQGGDLPAVRVAARTPTRPPPRRSPRCSPACSPRSACTRSSARRRCCSPTAGWTTLLMWAALATMVVGILGAVAQDDIKRLLSFTLVSHIGYMMFGIALATRGRADRRRSSTSPTTSPCRPRCSWSWAWSSGAGGSTSLDRLGGLAKLAPGARGPVLRARDEPGRHPAAVRVPRQGRAARRPASQMGTPLAYVLVAGSVVTSLLTLYALVKAWNKAFWQTPRRGAPAGAPAARDGRADRRARRRRPGA